jgi:hypothetical protein
MNRVGKNVDLALTKSKLPSPISEIANDCEYHDMKYTDFCQHHDKPCRPDCIHALRVHQHSDD